MKKQLRFLPAFLLSSALWTMAMDRKELAKAVGDIEDSMHDNPVQQDVNHDFLRVQWSSNPDDIGKTMGQIKQERRRQKEKQNK